VLEFASSGDITGIIKNATKNKKFVPESEIWIVILNYISI
jgi:hypothetical protein